MKIGGWGNTGDVRNFPGSFISFKFSEIFLLMETSEIFQFTNIKMKNGWGMC